MQLHRFVLLGQMVLFSLQRLRPYKEGRLDAKISELAERVLRGPYP
jgi:hypothetical protein